MKFLSTLVGAALMVTCGSAAAGLLDDENDLGQTIQALRSAIGNHPRVLKIEVEPNVVTVEAQDPSNLQHVNRWRCLDRILGFIPIRWVFGPEPVDLQLLDPALESNLFDLDAVAFSATSNLEKAAIERTHIRDQAVVKQMEIVRHTFILPQPKAGDIRWTLRIASGREHAEVYANAQGNIVGTDLSGTQWAKSVDLFFEPMLIADAAAAFREALGTEPVLTAVSIANQTVGFSTNLTDNTLAPITGNSLHANRSYSWSVDGLVQRLGTIDVHTEMGTQAPPPFSIDDVDWTIIAKLEESSLAKVGISQAKVTGIGVEKSTTGPGGAVLAWTVKVTEPSGEVTSVITDTKGVIQRVLLPESRRPKVAWMDPATLASAIASIGTIFGPDTKIASIVADDRGGRITVDEAANGGRPATFEFSPYGVTRAAITFSFASTGPRFNIADLASLTEQKIAALESDARKKLGGGKQVYLESVTFGAHPFVQKAGARAIEVRVRDIPEDSVRAGYGWIVYDFDGRVLDFSTL